MTCLFIYMFYRTEKTVINQVFIYLFSLPTDAAFKMQVNILFPLNSYFVYSLPEGLWLLCITISSTFFYLEINGRRLNLVYFPILFALILEFFQLLHLTNGRFDLMDILFSVAFWITGFLLTDHHQHKENILQTRSARSVFCVMSYSLVYLAHVNY